jgi:ribonuclease BN (tRNA processing enzyme)
MCLLIDDVLALDAGALTRRLSLSALFNLEAVLLTHGHFDHIRDIPTLGMNLFLHSKSMSLYGNAQTRENLAYCLLNGTVYSKFFEKPAETPTFRYNVVESNIAFKVGEYEVLALEMPHSIPTLGYQVTDSHGKKLLYTGDTGPGLAQSIKTIAPDLMVVEVTGPSRYSEFFSTEGQHLTPELLGRELQTFQRLKGYLPPVVCVHMSPGGEAEIEAEIETLSAELRSPIYLAHEGMTVTV